MNLGVVVLLILLVGSITSILSKRFKIAYAKLLVIVGLVISVAYHALGRPTAGVSGELIINIIASQLNRSGQNASSECRLPCIERRHSCKP